MTPIHHILDKSLLNFLDLPLLLCVPLVIALRRSMVRPRIAYFGYAICAFFAAHFQFHLYVDGGDTYMVLPLFLLRIVLFGALALFMTVSIRSSPALWLLGCSTVILCLALWLPYRRYLTPGLIQAYVLLVPVIAGWRRCDWWPGHHP